MSNTAPQSAPTAVKSNGHYPHQHNGAVLQGKAMMSLGDPSFPPQETWFSKHMNWIVPLFVSFAISIVCMLWGTAIFYDRTTALQDAIKESNAATAAINRDIVDVKVFIGRQDAINTSQARINDGILGTLSEIRSDVRSIRNSVR